MTKEPNHRESAAGAARTPPLAREGAWGGSGAAGRALSQLQGAFRGVLNTAGRTRGNTPPQPPLAGEGGSRRGEGATATTGGPASWAFPLFIFFGAAQILAAVIMFFAYNWRELPDMAKIALPQLAMGLGFLVFAISPRSSLIAQIAGIAATVMIGVSMAVVGQVYQLGADPWTLFGVWAAFALPLSLIARSDALFAVWFAIASTAYILWTEEHLDRSAQEMLAPASYAALAFTVLVIRDFVAAAAGPQPRWQRWLFAASALAPATIAAINEATEDAFFGNGVVGLASLAFVAGGSLFLYGAMKPDRPTRALALFAVAVFVGFLGVRTVWRLELDSVSGYLIGFLLSALWVVAVTAGLAKFLKAPR